MTEHLINKYLRIEPVAQQGFISTSKDTYEEIGTVVAKDDSIDIPVGAKVFFDGYMAKKYPIEGEVGKWQWYIHYDEVIKYEIQEIPK